MPPQDPSASPMDYLEAALQMAEEGQRDPSGYLDEQSHGALASLLPLLGGSPGGAGATETPEGSPEPVAAGQPPGGAAAGAQMPIERPSPEDLVELPTLLEGKLAVEDEEDRDSGYPTDTHGDFAPEPKTTDADAHRPKKPPRKRWKLKRRSKRRKG